MKKQDLKNAFATIVNGRLYVLPKDLIELIEESIDTLMIVDVSGEFLEKCGKWHVGSNSTILTDEDRKHYKDMLYVENKLKLI